MSPDVRKTTTVKEVHSVLMVFVSVRVPTSQWPETPNVPKLLVCVTPVSMAMKMNCITVHIHKLCCIKSMAKRLT